MSNAKPSVNYWVEVWVKREWISVDVVHGKVNCPGEMEERATKPLLYVIGKRKRNETYCFLYRLFVS